MSHLFANYCRRLTFLRPAIFVLKNKSASLPFQLLPKYYKRAAEMAQVVQDNPTTSMRSEEDQIQKANPGNRYRFGLKIANGARVLCPGMKQCEIRKVKPTKKLAPRPIMTRMQIRNMVLQNIGLKLTDIDCINVQSVLQGIFKKFKKSIISGVEDGNAMFPWFIRLSIKKTRQIKNYS